MVVPGILLLTFSSITVPTFWLSAYPITRIPSCKTPNDVYLLLNIRLTNISNNRFESISAKWEVIYNILPNSSREPTRVSLAETLPGWSGFSASLGDYPSENTTYFFNKNGIWTWSRYRTWKYSYASVLTLKWNSVGFPVDMFESPIIYVWTTPDIYPSIKLESPETTGFVFTLRKVGLTDPKKVYESFTIAQKLGQGLPSVQPFGFQLVIQRDSNFMLLYFLYFLFVFFLIYYIAALSRLTKMELERKIQLLATLSISVIAFIWTLRQIAGTICYIELTLMVEIFALIFIEVIFFIKIKKSTRTDKLVYVY